MCVCFNRDLQRISLSLRSLHSLNKDPRCLFFSCVHCSQPKPIFDKNVIILWYNIQLYFYTVRLGQGRVLINSDKREKEVFNYIQFFTFQLYI